MKPALVFPLLCFLAVYCHNLATALLIPYTLPMMVEKSKYIVIGEVIRLEKTNETFVRLESELTYYQATISVEEVIKGKPAQKSLQVHYFLHPEQPQFPLGQRMLYFLAQGRGNPARLHVTQGIYGEVVIGGDKVKFMFEGRGQEERALDTFLGSIRALDASTHH